MTEPGDDIGFVIRALEFEASDLGAAARRRRDREALRAPPPPVLVHPDTYQMIVERVAKLFSDDDPPAG